MTKSNSTNLLNLLRNCKYPNCTLYLIWHYVRVGMIDYAKAEFAYDYDKLGNYKQAVEKILEQI